MACQVDICDDALSDIDSWGLPSDVRNKLMRTIFNDLSTKLSGEIGEVHSVAPVPLHRYCLSIPDSTFGGLHHFVFLVNNSRKRRVVMCGKHRTGGAEF